MRHIILVLALFSTCCAHSQRLPQTRSPAGAMAPTWGAYAYQCVETREVVCLVDNDFTEAQCQETVVPAIIAINNAAGQRLFHFAGIEPFDMARGHTLVLSGVYTIFGSRMPEGILGETRSRFSTEPTAPYCIDYVQTSILPSVFANMPFARGVVLHEMLHALGAAHADLGARYESNMMPNANSPHWRNAMTPNDLAALRAMYPRQ